MLFILDNNQTIFSFIKLKKLKNLSNSKKIISFLIFKEHKFFFSFIKTITNNMSRLYFKNCMRIFI